MKPILFNTDMVKAILDGRKTVTRRYPFQMPEGYNRIKGMYRDGKDRLCAIFQCTDPEDPTVEEVYARYQPGDILWVRETWAKLWYADQNGCTHYDKPMYYYAADGTPDITLIDEDGFEKDDQRIRWRPSIHMPREAARIFLRVKEVTVERLQDCGNAQAKDEGCTCCSQFARVWESTLKPADRDNYGWEANPWVWVIKFERLPGEYQKCEQCLEAAKKAKEANHDE